MTKDARRLSDGFTELSGGCDSGISPSVIRPNQVSSAVNCTFRGAFIKPRPGVNKRTLSFPDGFGGDDGVLRGVFEDNKFQGAKAYREYSGNDVLITQIGGRQWKIDIANSYTVQDITVGVAPGVSGSPNSSLLEYTWMEQAEEFFIIQDGVSAPYIFDGASARRAGPREIPTGTVMSYQLGRLWIASPDRRQFVASDLVYGPSGTSTYNYRDAVLKMTENDLLVTGGAFAVPDNAGQITAMLAPAILDTVTGQSALQVFTRTTGFSVNAPVDRTLWKSLSYPIATVSLKNFGPIGQQSLVRINSDMWFRAQDGIRSFVLARRQFSLAGEKTWANNPVSDEIRTILDFDQQETLEHASAVNFDNRLLMTVSPVWTTHGTYFRGLVPMDFSVVSGMGRQSTPVWEGVWTGLKILQILTATVNSVERAFMFTLSTANKIELWELSKDAKADNNGTKRIVWTREDRSFQFGDGGLGLKQLMTAQHSIDEVYGTVDFLVEVRPDQYPLWVSWHSWSECSNYQDCNVPPCGSPQTGPLQYQLQYRPDIKLPQPPDTCNTSVGTPMNLGFEFQTRETVTGYCRIKKLVLHIHWKDETPQGECPGVGVCQSVAGCSVNPFTYSSE